MFPRQKKAVFTTLPKKIRQLWIFFPKFGNDRKIYMFFEKILSSSCSSRHRERTFDIPGSKFFPEDETFSCSKPKEMNKFVHFSEKSFFLKVFAGHEKCKLDNYAGMNSLNPIFFLLKAPKDGQKCTLFHQKKFSSKGLLDKRKAVLTSMPE